MLDRAGYWLAQGNEQRYDKIIDATGSVAANIVKDMIYEIREPPNSEETIALKDSSNPLIDTGKMKNAVTYKVIDVKK